MQSSLTFPHFLIGIFAVANNFPALGQFLQLCQGLEQEDRLKLCKTATLTSLVVMLVALILGRSLLDFFGISIEAFRIAGGLLLGFSGMKMLNVETNFERKRPLSVPYNYSRVISQAVIPIAIPLTTGAGTFSTIIIFVDEIGRQWMAMLMLILAILTTAIIVYYIFKYSMKLLTMLGHTGMNVLIKVCGLFTLALGIQFIIFGLTAAFPALNLN